MSLASHFLPITKRGNFFEDDFFSDFQPEYSSAVHDVLGRCAGRSLLADQFANYRKARQSEPEDDASLAASISDTPEQYVIVLDMSDFVSGEISVRNRKLNAVVDAKVGSTREFHRTYPLPKNTNTESLKAALSDEGILTITAKRLEGVESQITSSTGVETSSAIPEGMSSLKIDAGISEEASENTNAKPEEASSTKSERKVSSTSDAYTTLPISKRGQFFKDEFFKNVWSDFDSAMDDMVKRKKERQDKRQGERDMRDKATEDIIKQMMEDQEEQKRRLKQERMERQKKRSEDIQQTMKMFDSPMVDRFRSYKTLRSWAGDEENQAQTITSDDKAYKVVLDVKEYTDTSLDLKSDGEILTVSGTKNGAKVTREFSLPGMGAPELVSASLSEDGVLTITAPKK